MKTLKNILACILLVIAAHASAQDTYRDALEAYSKVNPKLQTFSGERMKPILTMLNGQLLTGKSLENSEELTDRYLKEQMYEDMIDMILPVMKEHVSESELKALATIMGTPEGKSFTTNNFKWENNMEEGITTLLGDAAKSISNGETPAPIQVNPQVSKSYESKFRTFIGATRQLEMFEKGMNLGANGMLPESVSAWIMDNVPNYFINTAHGILSESDLDFAIQLGDNPSYQNALKAALSMTDNAQAIGMTLINSYVSWLKKQGASVNDLGF